MQPPGGTTSTGVLAKQGSPRSQILLDGVPLADTDWLDPGLLVHPPSSSIEWPDPPSLIVCEPPEVGKPHQVVTRLALDGRILWTYRRAVEARSGARACLWQPTADGTRLLLFTSPNGLVGLDVATGLEAFRRVL
jgi:hypothetical protein